METNSKLKVTKIDNLNVIVLKQYGSKDFFLTAEDSIIIPVNSLSFILKFLVNNNYLSHRVLEGILEEYNSGGGYISD